MDMYLDVARRMFPVANITFEGEGQMSVAIRVDDSILLRFPRHEFGIESLKFEVALLELLRPNLTIQVPEVIDVALGAGVGESFVAHKLMPGHVLRRAEVETWSPSQLRRAGDEIRQFLHELHALTAPAKDLGTPVLTPRDHATVLMREFNTLIAPRVAPVAVDRAQRELTDLSLLPHEPALLTHTDLGGNILIDPTTGNLGAIDFGSCIVTHPALDLASIAVLGAEFLDACVGSDPGLQEAAAFVDAVGRTFTVQDALYGARQEDWGYVQSIMDSYSTS